jgi:plasmid stabilization system protein ParE
VTHRIHVAPEAETELVAAAQWYESKRPGLGVEFVAAIDAAFDRIRESPTASPMWRPGRPFRKHVVGRFPFVIFYCTDTESVDVYAVAHAKRRPGYWLAR